MRRGMDEGWGLSPRMRGSLLKRVTLSSGNGPIPAHAGEPTAYPGSMLPSWAYPRACGGALVRLPSALAKRGLSPRMRGSPAAKAG